MSRFAVRVAIAAPPAAVWDVLSRFERWPEWTASVTSLVPLGSSPPGLGARYRIVQPSLQPAELTITDWQPGERFVWVTRKPGLLMTADHVIRPSPGGSVVELTVRYEGLLGGLVGLMAGALTRRYMDMEAEGLQRRSEGKG